MVVLVDIYFYVGFVLMFIGEFVFILLMMNCRYVVWFLVNVDDLVEVLLCVEFGDDIFCFVEYFCVGMVVN